MTSHLYIGLMSGTSLDGVDGVLASFGEHGIETLASHSIPFAPDLREALMALQSPGPNEIEREAHAANLLAGYYAECVSALLPLAPEEIEAVCVHGQTIRHRPELGFTRQVNNPALLAELTGQDVIADLRMRDIAAGGQGAPLVPAFHAAAFGAAGKTRVVVNIGGIGNISVLHADGRVTGYDTGPGNVLMDLWIARHQGKAYDENGAWAASGQVDGALLTQLLKEPYFHLPAPKSTGRDLFHAEWLDAQLRHCTLSPADVMATLTELTAVSIGHAINAEAKHVEAVYVCGGGAYNATLLKGIAAVVGAPVASTDALGVAPNHVEALAFAWLGWQFSKRQAGNLPAVTGAKGPRVLGALYPA
ncbi:MAG: anhydro-N-acetylmuramic acid kinase [Caulobacter sp.]|jgi:anhydro-N-acetylmuramic acid kinase|nr:anhydro-N-acetylmuramic acid kinase [Caulobacter sp.]